MEIHKVQNNIQWNPNSVDHTAYLTDDDDFETGDSTAKLYERSRIKALAGEREMVQKKTFTKWVNSHLARSGMIVEDLYLDLRDGKVLLVLLEILSGEKLPYPTRGKMRIHCLENVDKSLIFLQEQHVHLENMGAHDIVDGNSNLTLGLIWTIILRFQIQDITIDEYDTTDARSAKDALLLWCQMKTAGYANVNVRNFTTSWRDGLAFNALIHAHCPELIDYPKLSKTNPLGNLNNAFDVAEDLGITKLLDPEDVNVEQPDEKSIITYVVSFYHFFNRMKANSVHSKRIGKVVSQAMDCDAMIEEYEMRMTDLLAWIEATIVKLNDREFANSLSGVQQQLAVFNTYRTVEKPPKFIERGDFEVLLFTIQSKMLANNRKPYFPAEGKMISDINKAWERLERAEHERELSLRIELIRQERLEQLAVRFDRKAGMREAWLTENKSLVQRDNFGDDLAAVEAATKKHEAIETDIFAYEERVRVVIKVCEDLRSERYHDINRIAERKENVYRLWEELLELLSMRRRRLDLTYQLQHVFQEISYLMDWIEEISTRLRSEDYGKHLLNVQDLLEKHALLEADIRVLEARMTKVLASTSTFIECKFDGDVGDYKPIQPEEVERRCKELQDAFEKLLDLAKRRRKDLDSSRDMWQFFWDMADEKEWIKEKKQLMVSPDLGHDLSSALRLQRKHITIEKEITNHEILFRESIAKGEHLLSEKNMFGKNIQNLLAEMHALWAELEKATLERRKRLENSIEFYQLLADCDDAEAWILDEIRLVKNEDTGQKLSNTESLIRKHAEDMENIQNFGENVALLRQQGDKVSVSPDTDKNKVSRRLADIDKLYDELLKQSGLRKGRLGDAKAVYELSSVADSVKSWIIEKEKLLTTLVPSDEPEELEVIRHRFDCFEAEMAKNFEKVDSVNDISQTLQASTYVDPQQIGVQQEELNVTWNDLADLVDKKKKEIDTAYRYNQFLIESGETANWITEKRKLIESTDEFEGNLDGIMQMQRRLGRLQTDLVAIEAKVNHLDKEANELKELKPEVRTIIQPEQDKIHQLWIELKDALKQRDDRLSDSSELQKFLQDLDDFQLWLKKTQTAVASEDFPNNLQEAEKLLAQHEDLKTEIASYKPEFHRLMDFGQRVFAGGDDSQHVFMRHRLDGVADSWGDIQKMCDDRDRVLKQGLDAQTFFRDALQSDITLSKQETFLAKEDAPTSHVAAEEAVRNFDIFVKNVNSNEPKLDDLLSLGDTLVASDNYCKDRIQAKCDQLRDKRDGLKDKLNQRDADLHDQLELQEYIQDVEDMEEWVAEKAIAATDDDFRDSKTVTARYGKFRAFEEELGANTDNIQKCIDRGNELKAEKPHLVHVIEPKIEELQAQWQELNKSAAEKSNKLADANREILYDETAKNMMTWFTTVENQVIVDEVEETEEIGLVEINEQMKLQEKRDNELFAKKKQLEEMEDHAKKLKEQYPEREQEFEQVQKEVRIRLTQAEAPLQSRRDKLYRNKRVRQFLRDIEDEKEWCVEKLNLVNSRAVPTDSLPNCERLLRRVRTLSNEVDNHRPQIDNIFNVGEEMINEGHPQSPKFRVGLDELSELWNKLLKAILTRLAELEDNLLVHQYLSDVAEAEAWMGEQELYLMGDERAKDDIGAERAMKKQNQLEECLIRYEDEIKSLADRAKNLADMHHPAAPHILQKQDKIEKMYVSLRELCSERDFSLSEIVKLYHLLREIQDLESWIAERTLVARSHEMGSDYEHCCLLRDRFAAFALETNDIGTPRVDDANRLCDDLINQGHGESAEIAQWKDRINEAWADLLELIETRIQLLKAAWDLHKFLCDCQDVLDRISEKAIVIPEESGKDAKSVATYQRKHSAFEKEVQNLGHQVENIVDEATHLLPSYAGDKERLICDRRDEVLSAWQHLQMATEARKARLTECADLHSFLAMVRELMRWMEEIRLQIGASSEKPRDVSGVELLINNHRSVKAEIDAREENFSICLSLGRALLNRRHPMQDEVRQKCKMVVTTRLNLVDLWTDQWDHLQLILEVYQYARDAAIAEAWLIAQEPYLTNKDLGESLDETLALLKKHATFERTAQSQEERFQALRKLTTLELRERKRSREAEAAKEAERKRKVAAAIAEFEPPPLSSIRKQQRQPEDTDVVVRAKASPQHAAASSPAAPSPTSSARDDRPITPISLEGLLQRKHEWESESKKASNRTWHELYVSLTGSTLSVYKDRKHCKEKPSDFYHNEAPFSISNAQAAPASDYSKKPHVFRLKLQNGGEYLFQAKTDADMLQWIQVLNRASSADSSGTGQARSAVTLPATSATMVSSGESERQASGTGGTKKKFFTLGRKK